jgi:hypothetical protein
VGRGMLKKGRARFLDKFKSKGGATKPLEVPDDDTPQRSMYTPPLFFICRGTIFI